MEKKQSDDDEETLCTRPRLAFLFCLLERHPLTAVCKIRRKES